MASSQRTERMQIMVTDDELAAIDEWRFTRQMPSRAAAIRELLRRGLTADGFDCAARGIQSKAFGIIEEGLRDRRQSFGLHADPDQCGKAGKPLTFRS